MLAAVSAPRLDNVLSKTVRVEARCRVACRKLCDELMRDVQDALVEDGLLSLEEEEQDEGGASALRRRHAALHSELEVAARKLVTRFLRAQM